MLKKITKNILILITLICFIPFLLSYITLYIIKPNKNTTNYGSLIFPKKKIPISLCAIDYNNNINKIISFKKNWLIVSFNNNICNRWCTKKLYFLNKIKQIQLINKKNITSIFFYTNKSNTINFLHKNYNKNIIFYLTKQNQIKKWLSINYCDNIENYIYLIDPFGNLIMRFYKNISPTKINKDITSLIKNY